MKSNFCTSIGLVGFIVGFVGIGYAIGSRKRFNDICEKIDTKVDEISGNIDVKIEESIINEAIDRAVEVRVSREVNHAVNHVAKDISDEIRADVCNAVKKIYPDIQKSCTDKVNEEVSKINVSELRDIIREDAKEKVAEKFDGQLDDILESFNSNLHNISKIYSSITKKITESNIGKDLIFRLG